MCVCVCVCVMIQRERVFGTFEMWREIAERERERESERVTLWLPFGCFERHTPLRGLLYPAPLDNRKTDQTVNV